MSEKAGYGGRGGYGGISTMNQDQRQGRYWPHPATSARVDYLTDEVIVHCLKCDVEWRHPRGDVKGPVECKTAERSEAPEENP